MNIGDLPLPRLARLLAREGLCLRVGPFLARVTSPLPAVARHIAILYPDRPLEHAPFADFRVRLAPGRGLGRFRRESCRLLVDGEQWATFVPRLAPAYLEWGLNWCIFRRAHHFLVIHAATVERDGLALLLPATSGSGKSTLAAALVHHGWRLFSDELALVAPGTGLVHAAAKAICLKNASLAAVRAVAPAARFGPAYRTPEGDAVLAHVRPPADPRDARERRDARETGETPGTLEKLDAETPARPRLIVFPRYEAGSPTLLEPVPRGTAFMEVAQAAFNYTLLGRTGFDTLAGLIEGCETFRLTFSDLGDAIARLDELARLEPAGLDEPARPHASVPSVRSCSKQRLLSRA